MTAYPEFEALARAAAELNAEDERAELEPHWSDDPRFDSKAHYDAVMAGNATLPPVNGTAERNDSDGIDRHAAGCSHDAAGFRIL